MNPYRLEQRNSSTFAGGYILSGRSYCEDWCPGPR